MGCSHSLQCGVIVKPISRWESCPNPKKNSDCESEVFFKFDSVSVWNFSKKIIVAVFFMAGPSVSFCLKIGLKTITVTWTYFLFLACRFSDCDCCMFMCWSADDGIKWLGYRFNILFIHNGLEIFVLEILVYRMNQKIYLNYSSGAPN